MFCGLGRAEIDGCAAWPGAELAASIEAPALRVTGRSDDMIIVRGVNVFPSQIEEQIFKDERLSPHYVLELSRKGRLDALTVVVEPRPGQPLDGDDSQAAEVRLADDVRAFTGVHVAVRLVPAGGIERSMGKARRIVDLRDKRQGRGRVLAEQPHAPAFSAGFEPAVVPATANSAPEPRP